ncbi:MAG: sulfite exporter TauE/SafE family protein [Flavobacteriales bacterium]
MSYVIAALILGLGSNLHCLGMCGPLNMALPIGHYSPPKRLFMAAVYHSGRLMVYGLLGLFAGSVGAVLALGTYHEIISIVFGSLIILMALFSFIKVSKGARWGNRLSSAAISYWKQRKSPFAFLIMGAANGLLPCGMVYIAMAGAVATGYGHTGMAFMLIFGAGTLPLTMGVALFTNYFSKLWKVKLLKKIELSKVFAVTVGLLLIVRGLSLGIPYISPKIEAETGIVKSCCSTASSCETPNEAFQ